VIALSSAKPALRIAARRCSRERTESSHTEYSECLIRIKIENFQTTNTVLFNVRVEEEAESTIDGISNNFFKSSFSVEVASSGSQIGVGLISDVRSMNDAVRRDTENGDVIEAVAAAELKTTVFIQSAAR
jgi:hypothetical protein